jgi:hypothetical protein
VITLPDQHPIGVLPTLERLIFYNLVTVLVTLPIKYAYYNTRLINKLDSRSRLAGAKNSTPVSKLMGIFKTKPGGGSPYRLF